jgi:hypothetical protein
MRRCEAQSRQTRSAIERLLADFWSGRLPPNEALAVRLRAVPPQLAQLRGRGPNLDALAEALRKHPRLLVHPLVWGQLWQLRQQSLRDPDDEAREAWAAFRQLVEAWLHGFLPGWRLSPPPARRGRRVTWEECQRRFTLCGDYKELLGRLKAHHVRRMPKETDQAWRTRLIGILKRLWGESDASLVLAFTRKTKRSKRRNATFRVRLPRSDVKIWVDEAVERADEATLRDHLAYRLVGHLYHRTGGRSLTSGQVRAIIQQERRQRPRFLSTK